MMSATEGDEATGRSSDAGGRADSFGARRLRAHHWRHVFDTSREMYLHVKPPAGELSADWVMYAEWPSIVTCYNGVEMVMKLLLYQQGHCGPDRWRQELGHDLARAWDRLDQGTRDHVEYHYAQHRSLQYYPDLPVESATADSFVRHINGENHLGSVAWRYAPLMDDDGSAPPRLLAWTMFEVWNSLICCLESMATDDGDHRWCRCLVSHMVCEGGDLAIEASDFNGASEAQQHPRLKREALEELFGWLWGTDSWAETILANTIRWLAVHVRDAWHELDLSDPLIEYLKSRAVATMRKMRDSNDPDMNRLWHRLMLSNGRLMFGNADAPGEPSLPRFEFSVEAPYNSKFAVCDDGDIGERVKASDLLVGDAVAMPALSRLSLEPRSAPTGATLSVPGCALEEIRLDAPNGHPAGFAAETVWCVDEVAAHLCEDRVIGERTVSFSDSMGARLTLRLGDNQRLLSKNDEVTNPPRRDYRFIVALPYLRNERDAVLDDLRQRGYTDPRRDTQLVRAYRDAEQSYQSPFRSTGPQRQYVLLISDTGTLTDIVDTHIREIHNIIAPRWSAPERESLRIENRCGDIVRIVADRPMRSATTIATETRLLGLLVP